MLQINDDDDEIKVSRKRRRCQFQISDDDDDEIKVTKKQRQHQFQINNHDEIKVSRKRRLCRCQINDDVFRKQRRCQFQINVDAFRKRRRHQFQIKNDVFRKQRRCQFQMNEDDKIKVSRKRRHRQFQVDSSRILNVSIADIPEEVVIKILGYLPRNDLLLNAALVCSEWRRLTESRQLWRRIDLTGIKNVSSELVQKLLKKSQNIIYINLYNCTFIEDSVLLEIAKQIKLQTLILGRSSRFSERCVRCELDSIVSCSEWAKHALRRNCEIYKWREELEMISLSCANLVELDVSECFHLTTAGLVSVVRHCKGLKRLNINKIRGICDDVLSALTVQPSPIEVLCAVNCHITPAGFANLRKLPKLEYLDVSKVFGVEDDWISQLSNFSALILNGSVFITNEGVSAVVSNNPKLKQLGLSQCQIDDDALKAISVSSCRSTLEILNVGGCRRLSELGVDYILRSCVRLKSLTLSVESSDCVIRKQRVIQWQAEYPHINFEWLTKYPDFGGQIEKHILYKTLFHRT